MSIGKRLIYSFIVILSLFSINLIINLWANVERSKTLNSFRHSVEKQMLVANLEQKFSQRVKESQLYYNLRATLNSNELSAEEAEKVGKKLTQISTSIKRLHQLSDPEDFHLIEEFSHNYALIKKQWLKLYLSLDKTPPELPRAETKRIFELLAKIQRQEQQHVKQSALTVEETTQNVRLLNLSIFSVTSALAILISFFLIRFIRNNLQILKQGADAFAAGKLKHRIRIKRKDEFGTLAESYNNMAKQLKNAMEKARTAKVEAEQANQSKSAFLANMSHELRTPMNAILGYSEILIEEAEESGQQDYVDDLEKIRSAGKHLLALINDVLDLSKIEAGKMTLFLETFNVSNLIQEITNTAEPLMQQNSNQFIQHIDAAVEVMHADATKLRQTLFNLLSNAAKFTKNGSIDLSVTKAIIDDTEIIQFTITDTGIGMTPEQSKRIFDEFTQADNSTTRQYGGTGLGLAISKRFCEMMQGSITVESEPGKGSRFTINLPQSVAEQTAESNEKQGSFSTGKKILVIDDDKNMHELMRRMLAKDGFSVISANSGPEGIKFAREYTPDAITLDVLMPEMDGWEVLKTLKNDPLTTNIPIVMLSMCDAKKQGYELGATDYISKPVDKVKLLSALNHSINQSESGEILIVEDNITTRRLYQKIFKPYNWTITEAENGRDALTKLEKSIPKVIILDLLMPEMDGITFLNHLRVTPVWRSIPVVVVTAKKMSEKELIEVKNKAGIIISKIGTNQRELVTQLRNALTEFTIFE